MGVLARSRNLDRAGPVEVEVAQREGELLQLNLRKVRVVLRDVEVRWQHTALSRIRGCQEEVKHRLWVAAAFVFDQSLVDDAPRWWVPQLAFFVFHEESLIDPFVNNNNCDLGLSGSLVVDLVDRFLELRDLRGEHLVPHSIANAITIQDEVGWELLVVEASEYVNRIFQCILHP